MTDAVATQTRSTFGWAGFTLGAIAFLTVLVLFWGGPFGSRPAPLADPSVSERLVDAARGVLGGTSREAAPVPAPSARTIDEWLALGAVGMAGAAVVLGLAGFARGERKRPAFSAVTLGGGAILFQLVTGLVLILICLMLIGGLSKGGESFGEIVSGILETIGGIFSAIGAFFSNLFGGLFGN